MTAPICNYSSRNRLLRGEPGFHFVSLEKSRGYKRFIANRPWGAEGTVEVLPE